MYLKIPKSNSKYPKVPQSTHKYLTRSGLVWSGLEQFGRVWWNSLEEFGRTVWNSLEQFGTVWNSLEQFGTLRAISGWMGLDWMGLIIPEQIGYKITAERC